MIEYILKLASTFESLASSSGKEKIPKKTSDMKEFINNLNKLESFSAKKEYCEKCLEQLSSGSSRVVFKYSKDTVLKLAFNDKGIAQNKAEASIKDDSKYINKVTKTSEDFSWIMTPLANKITERQFFDITGINFKEFGEVVKYIMRELSTKERPKPESFEELKDENIVKEITDIGLKHKLMPGDIARISSWKVIDDTPVLVDLGLTQEIYKKFYAKKKSEEKSKKDS